MSVKQRRLCKLRLLVGSALDGQIVSDHHPIPTQVFVITLLGPPNHHKDLAIEIAVMK